MQVKTNGGQTVELREKIDDFGFELIIFMDGTEYAIELTRTELHFIELMFRKALKL